MSQNGKAAKATEARAAQIVVVHPDPKMRRARTSRPSGHTTPARTSATQEAATTGVAPVTMATVAATPWKAAG